MQSDFLYTINAQCRLDRRSRAQLYSQSMAECGRRSLKDLVDAPEGTLTAEEKQKLRKARKEEAKKAKQQKVQKSKDPQLVQQTKPKESSSSGGKGRPDSAGAGGSKPKQKSGGAEARPETGAQGQASAPEGAEGGKSKAQLKAERRAKQEAQRAAKSVKKPDDDKKSGAPRVPESVKADVEESQKKVAKRLKKGQIPQRSSTQRQVGLFAHLHQYGSISHLTESLRVNGGKIHPAILRLGLKYASGAIRGSNARCVAMLAAFRHVVADYTTPEHKDLSRDLEMSIRPYIDFLNQCRTLSVSMGNAIKYFKYCISELERDISDDEAKAELQRSLDEYYRLRIKLPGTAIANFALKKITDGDVIMVYAYSSLILTVLERACKAGRQFRVIVCDSRPRSEGRLMVKKLTSLGLSCTYVCITAVSHVMPEVTKLLLGTYALLSNGHVMSRVGSAQVALVAKSHNVPVLVCCETHKFTERVQTDSFVFNELGDPNALVSSGVGENKKLGNWHDNPSLTLLNLTYDVTPPELVTLVITELGMLPCTSVPVVLRVQPIQMTY